MRQAVLLLVSVALAIPNPCLLAQDSAAPKTHTVETAPFRVTVDLSGVFEQDSMTELRLTPKAWSKFVVKSVVPQGTRVAAGDAVLVLESDDLENAIRDAEYAVTLGRLSLSQAQEEMKVLEASLPLDLEAAERAKKYSDEDLEYYRTVGAELQKRLAERSMRMAQEQLEYAQEELNQLEKMYKADDLTEETEEIILLRTRRDVEHATFSAETAKLRFDKSTNLDMPREKLQAENSAVRQNLALQRAKVALPSAVEQKRIELEKQTQAQKQAELNRDKLLADRELMTLEAPVAGVVRYGQCERGRWTTGAQLQSQLREGGTLTANTTLFTIVSGDQMFIRVDVPEAQLHLLTPGKTGTATPTANSRLRLAAKLESVGDIPVKDGTFDGRVSFTGDRAGLTAGMNCSVKLVAYASESALSVPTSAIFSDDGDEASKHVFIAGETPEKRAVKTGHVRGDATEILDGLKAGDVILLEKPKS
ncbi:MAG: HlyD family efflux transporter periplasmic adaptor subunit [Planctomyces sp.]|nr:HlyD family efflux transporter periplasmic adaptor subunit [Planctomyces sp.]